MQTGVSRTHGRRVVIVAFVGLIGVLTVAAVLFRGSPASSILSFAGRSAGGEATFGPAMAAPAAPPASAAGLSGSSSAGTAAGATGNTYDLAQPELMIIKNGTLDLQVAGLDDAIGQANGLIDGLGGYVSGSQRSGDGDSAQAQVTYRVPAARFDDAMAGLRGLAVEVVSEQSSTDDVTGQVLDLGARIRNLKATELALQGIMAKATAIKDVLAVQDELTNVQGQIEQLTTEQGHLQDQAAMSTLSVTFGLKPNPVQVSQQQFDPGSEVNLATAQLVDVLQALATAGIWFGIVWLPILFALALLAGIIILLVRRLRPRSAAVPIAPGA
jgi:Domain of unknown function (DUF4349)